MTFTNLCVFIVLFAAILAVTWMIGEYIYNDCDYIMGWIISTFGFAICLTWLLIQNGII